MGSTWIVEVDLSYHRGRILIIPCQVRGLSCRQLSQKQAEQTALIISTGPGSSSGCKHTQCYRHNELHTRNALAKTKLSKKWRKYSKGTCTAPSPTCKRTSFDSVWLTPTSNALLHLFVAAAPPPLPKGTRFSTTTRESTSFSSSPAGENCTSAWST